jgi:hypothetical protein
MAIERTRQERTVRLEKSQALKLLRELNRKVGSHSPSPHEYQDWNMRARTFLVFAACRRIANGDLGAVGLKE